MLEMVFLLFFVLMPRIENQTEVGTLDIVNERVATLLHLRRCEVCRHYREHRYTLYQRTVRHNGL